MDINNFGRNSFIGATGLIERIEAKEIQMKEIKYRAWDTETESYVDNGFDFRIDGSGYIYRRAWGETVWDRTTTLIIEQQTGLCDKNGTEGYKSDIIKGIHKTTKEIVIGEVVWDDGSFQWGIQLDTWIMVFPCLISCYDFEIIGNRWEDPKLLEQNDGK